MCDTLENQFFFFIKKKDIIGISNINKKKILFNNTNFDVANIFPFYI